MNPQHRSDLIVNKEYLYRNYKSYDDLGYNRQQRKQMTKKSLSPDHKAKTKVPKYESPFIQKSRERALQRAKEKKSVFERQKKPWNDDFATKPIEFFDGGKKEDRLQIFKREPRKPPEKVQSKDNNSRSMTRRRNENDVPLMPSRMPSSPSFSTFEKYSKLEEINGNVDEIEKTVLPSPTLENSDSKTLIKNSTPAPPIPPPPSCSVYSHETAIQTEPSSPLISATIRSQFSPRAAPLFVEQESIPFGKRQNFEPRYPATVPQQYINLEPEIVRVKTRGTSPFSSIDFEKLFGEVPVPPISKSNPSSPRPRVDPKPPPASVHPESANFGIEAATLRILESQTKAQEANGEMIGKFTNLVAELGKIITHREDSYLPKSTKRKKKNPQSSTLNSQSFVLPSSPKTIPPQQLSSSTTDKKSYRSRREDILDHILQRLQVIETQEFAISESLSLKIEDSPKPVLPVKPASPNSHTDIITTEEKNYNPPQISNTFELGADILTLAEVGSGWLLPDGREEKRTRKSEVGAAPVDSQIKGLITIRAQAPLKQDLADYRKDFHRSTLLKESVFRHHHTSLAEVADSLTEHIMETMLEEAAGEFEKVFSDLAEKFIEKI